MVEMANAVRSGASPERLQQIKIKHAAQSEALQSEIRQKLALDERGQKQQKALADARDQDRLDRISKRLKELAKPYIIAGEWAEAASFMEQDKEYQANREKLPDISERIKDFREKAKRR